MAKREEKKKKGGRGFLSLHVRHFRPANASLVCHKGKFCDPGF